MAQWPPILEEQIATLPEGLRLHVERARAVGQRLAESHGIDTCAVDLALAAHDIARAMDVVDIMSEAQRLGLRIDEVEHPVPVLLHSHIAATWLERKFGVSDKRVLDAVRWHSTGRASMDGVSKVVFLADKIEPEKVAHNPALTGILELAMLDLDAGLLQFIDTQIVLHVGRGLTIHPKLIEMRNGLLKRNPPSSERGLRNN